MRSPLLLLTLGLLLTAAPAQATPEADRLLQEATAPHTLRPNARQKLETALQIYQRANDRPGIERASLPLAELAYQDNDTDALARYLAPINLPQNPQYLGLAGLLELDRANYPLARPNLLRATHLSQYDQSLPYRIATGKIDRYQRRYRQALSNFNDAYRGSLNPILQADGLQGIADVNLDLGQYPEAIAAYKTTLALRQSQGTFAGARNQSELIRALNHLGRAHQALGQTDLARKSYQTALDRIRTLTDNQETINLLNQIALLEIDSQNFPAALSNLQESDRLLPHHTETHLHIENRIAWGNYHRASGNSQKAETYYQEAIEIASRRQDIVNQTRALTELGQLRLKHDPQGAIAPLQTSINLYEAQRPGLRDSEKISIADRQNHTYQLLQKALVQQNQPEAALLISERGRARAFADLLAQRQDSDTKTIAPPPSLEEIKNIARQGRTTLVTYSLISDRTTETDLYIWVITPDGTITLRTTDLQAKSLSQLAAQTRTAAQNGEVSTLAAQLQTSRAGIKVTRTTDVRASQDNSDTLRKGYDLLIAPIADLLPRSPDERITFIPQGSLFLVPFHALQTPQNQFLIQTHTLSLAPSLQTLTQAKKNHPTGKPLIVGNPSPMVSGLSALPGSEREAKAIAQLLNTAPLLGPQATKGNVLSQIKEASILHFATHGLLDDQQGMESAIALVGQPKAKDPDGWDPSLLTADELSSYKLQADLAVLSACNTGRGRITGDGVVGLSRSLMSAGVSTVVVSLWEVPDGATQQLMTAFYQKLQVDGDKAKAFRGAMLETMEKEPSPNSWAGFMLVGSGQ